MRGIITNQSSVNDHRAKMIALFMYFGFCSGVITFLIFQTFFLSLFTLFIRYLVHYLTFIFQLSFVVLLHQHFTYRLARFIEVATFVFSEHSINTFRLPLYVWSHYYSLCLLCNVPKASFLLSLSSLYLMFHFFHSPLWTTILTVWFLSSPCPSRYQWEALIKGRTIPNLWHKG